MAKTLPTIAIVCDDPSVLKALARLLGSRSIAARSFVSARQFIASLADERPDCLILDLQMPEMTGLELQRDLAANNIRIPTIIVTANDEPDMREKCVRAARSPICRNHLTARCCLPRSGRQPGAPRTGRVENRRPDPPKRLLPNPRSRRPRTLSEEARRTVVVDCAAGRSSTSLSRLGDGIGRFNRRRGPSDVAAPSDVME